MNKRVTIFGAGMLVAIATMATVNLTNFSLQQALNQLAGNDVAPYTRYSAQQAANLILANVPEEHDDMIPTVTFVWDDQARELWGESDSLLINPTGNVKMRIRDILHTFNIDGGLAIAAKGLQHGDTVGTSLSISMVRALVGRGWDVGIVGWEEIAGMYRGTNSLLANGYTTAQADSFYNNIYRGVVSHRDTLGLGHPRWISHSNASATNITNLAASRSGITYGFQSQGSATGSGSFDAAMGYGVRQNELYTVDAGRFGAWGTGGAGGRPVAAVPGIRGSRYEILQGMGEQSDSAGSYGLIRRAMQTKGLAVFIGHRASSWETVLAGQNGFYKFMEYLAALRDAGRIQILTPGDAADYYYRDTFSPLMNFAPENFADYDGDTHLDGWFGNRGTSAAADTAKIKPWGTATSGHDGRKAYSLNWTGEDGSTAWVPGATANDPWEGTRACLAVFPPAGGGWTAQFECWVIADSLVAGGGYASISGDTLGVVFGGPIEKHMNRWGTGTPYFGWWSDTAEYAPLASTPLYAAYLPGNHIRLGSRNNISRVNGKQWAHLIATWDVPEISDYLLISIWKTAQSPANGVLISDYSVTFYRRGN